MLVYVAARPSETREYLLLEQLFPALVFTYLPLGSLFPLIVPFILALPLVVTSN